jgi:uncharacterized protein
MPLIVTLSVLLVAYNAAINLLPMPRWTYVPLNLAATGALLVLARSRGLTWDDLGLAREMALSGLRWGGAAAVAVAVAVAIGVLAGDRIPGVSTLLADRRAEGMSGGELVYQTLLRIPLGTALFEEVAFRGVLLALVARHRSMLAAVIVSSVVFGLWHVGPGLATLRLNEPGMSAVGQLVGVSGMVAVTTVAGVGFCLLRLGSGSLLAPVLTHWATNAFGLLGAATVQRAP